MSELLQVWVRNDKGQVYGPLTPPSVELLIDNGVIAGRMQISTDGMNYVYPGRVPGLRVIFPKETWGDTVIPGDELDAQWGQVVLPAAITGSLTGSSSGPAAAAGGPALSGPAPGGPVPGGPVPGGPVAGPGVRGPVAGPGIRGAPTAGPGARPQPGRPGGPPPGVQSRPSGINTAPRAGSSVADFMNSASPSAVSRAPTSAVGTGASSPSAVRSSPSIADFINAATPSAQARPPPPTVSSQPRPAPVSSPSAARPSAPPPPVGELRVPASGELSSELTPQHLYYRAVVSEATGLLTLKLPDRELQLHFKRGNPEFLDSTHPEDSLETFLLAQKLATKAQIDQAQPQAARFGGELLGALFGLGLLNPNAVFQHLGQRASQLLQKVLSASRASFTFDLEELPAARSMPMGNKWAVYLEALRRVPITEVRQRLMSALSLPAMKGSGSVEISDLRLTPQETRALNYFDGVRSLAQLTQEVAGEGEVILRVAWMLAPLELISFANVPTQRAAAAPPPPPKPAPGPAPVAPKPAAAAAPPKPAAPPVAPPRPGGPAPGNPVNMPKPGMPYPGGSGQPAAPAAAPAAAPQRPPPPVMKPAAPPPKPVVTAAPAAPAAPANVDAEIKQLQAVLEQMKKQNFFEVLGLKRDADAGAVKIAYLKAARSYHPDTVQQGAPEALGKVKADIFALIGEANRTLSDPALRQDYTAELDAGGTGSKVDIEKILGAEESFQKGRILVQARKYADALKQFDVAVSCNPDEAEFYAWRGYAKYLAASDRKAMQHEAVREINLCVAKNPNVATAYYFLGFIAKHNGDEKNAMVHFKKCVALDPKHIDAMREVRGAGKK